MAQLYTVTFSSYLSLSLLSLSLALAIPIMSVDHSNCDWMVQM
jgi:hypothetical protein